MTLVDARPPALTAGSHMPHTGPPAPGWHRALRPLGAFAALGAIAAMPLVTRAPVTEPAAAAARPRTAVSTPAVARPIAPAAVRARPVRATRGAARVAVAVPPRVVGSRVARVPVQGRSFSGYATWYGPGFHGRRTANGETFDTHEMTAAHKTLPFGTLLHVCTYRRCVDVRINDRGPFGRGRVVDLSYAAARQLGIAYQGVAWVSATPTYSRWETRPIFAPSPVRAVPPAVADAPPYGVAWPDRNKPLTAAQVRAVSIPATADASGGLPVALFVGLALAFALVLGVRRWRPLFVRARLPLLKVRRPELAFAR